jgi:hypothetical protein
MDRKVVGWGVFYQTACMLVAATLPRFLKICQNSSYAVGMVGGQIKMGHLKFNLCKSDH